MNPPCTLNSSTWELSNQYCKHCGHSGWLHPGGCGSGSNITACLICDLIHLTTVLTVREQELAALIRTHRTPRSTADYHLTDGTIIYGDRQVVIP